MSMQCPACLTNNLDHAIACLTCGSSLVIKGSYYLPSNTVLNEGQYQIENVIGEGGFGITYKGKNLSNFREVAIKESWPEGAGRRGTTVIWPQSIPLQTRKQQIQEFANEARVLSKCNHPHIVKIHDQFEENNTAYIVMSFVKGTPLSKVIKKQGVLSSASAKRYLIQVAKALRTVHAANLLHRDIKPDNILIDELDRAILIDFGAAREFVAGKTKRLTVMLTPGYAPLEQYSQKGKRYASTDIYALCASMYEAVTGTIPLPATDRAILDNLAYPSKLVSYIDPSLEKVLLKGMQMRADKRFQSVEELMAELGDITETARLVSLHQTAIVPEFVVEDRTVIGRFLVNAEPENTSCINLDSFAQDNTISRFHASIYREQQSWKIKDLGSVNGIFIKPVGQIRFGRRIDTPETLHHGDEIALGKIRFRFLIT